VAGGALLLGKKPFETLDYLVPIKQGGGVTVHNFIPAGNACKTAKKPLSEAKVQAFHAYLSNLPLQTNTEPT